jgi:hypothetical protein
LLLLLDDFLYVELICYPGLLHCSVLGSLRLLLLLLVP